MNSALQRSFAELLTGFFFWILKPHIGQLENVVLHPSAPSKRLNVAARHKEAPTGQQMSHCCPTFSALWEPPYVGPCAAKHAVEHA